MAAVLIILAIILVTAIFGPSALLIGGILLIGYMILAWAVEASRFHGDAILAILKALGFVLLAIIVCVPAIWAFVVFFPASLILIGVIFAVGCAVAGAGGLANSGVFRRLFAERVVYRGVPIPSFKCLFKAIRAKWPLLGNLQWTGGWGGNKGGFIECYTKYRLDRVIGYTEWDRLVRWCTPRRGSGSSEFAKASNYLESAAYRLCLYLDICDRYFAAGEDVHQVFPIEKFIRYVKKRMPIDSEQEHLARVVTWEFPGELRSLEPQVQAYRERQQQKRLKAERALQRSQEKILAKEHKEEAERLRREKEQLAEKLKQAEEERRQRERKESQRQQQARSSCLNLIGMADADLKKVESEIHEIQHSNLDPGLIEEHLIELNRRKQRVLEQVVRLRKTLAEIE